MENNSFDTNSPPPSPEDAEKPDKDIKKKQKAERDLAKSIDKLPLFERPKEEKTKKAEQPAESEAADQPVLEAETLSDQETSHVQQEIAREHLQAIEQVDSEVAEELEPAVDFLQRVSEGQDVETAYSEAAAEAGIEEFTPLAPAENVSEEVIVSTAESTEGQVDWRSTPTARPAAPAVVAPAAETNAMPSRAEVYYTNRSNAGELLLIGMVGYLIGRRRGRIRTEKKLLPLQRKLEKQVTELEQDITTKEQQLVAAVAAKRKVEGRLAAMQAPVERAQPGRTETRLGMEKPVRAERLGHMAMAGGEARKLEQVVEKPNSIRRAFRAEQVPDMQRNELLELSEKIVVEGASLRRIYESHLIGEKQLRHLVSEYLQGKDISKDLRREMVEHEIDFERDPILRDRVRSRLSSSDGGGLGDMLAKAGIKPDEQDPTIEHRVKAEEARQEKAKQQDRGKRVAADVGMLTAIVVLAVIVAILVFTE